MNPEQQQQISELVAQGRLKDAIQAFLASDPPPSLLQEALAIHSRYTRLLSKRRLGILQFSEDTVTENQISASLLELLRFPSDQPFPAIQSIDARVPLRAIWWKRITATAIIAGLLAALTTIIVNANHMFAQKEPGSRPNTVTVLVHGPSGTGERMLPGRGLVTLLFGDAAATEQTNNEGEVTFKQIDDRFFEPEARVKILFLDPLGESYRAIRQDSLYRLERGKMIELPVELYGIDLLKGRFTDAVTTKPIPGVRVSIADHNTLTDANGFFVLCIPKQDQKKFQAVFADKDGYKSGSWPNVPLESGEEAQFQLKPQRD